MDIPCRGSCSTAEECLICDEADKTSMTGYRVFDGIELVYNDIEKDTCGIERSAHDHFFEINHCRDGRVEYEADGEFYYLTPGDLSVSRSSCIGRDSYFPLGHYRGISIIVDLEKAPGCLSCVLDDVDVSPDALVKKFCTDRRGFIVRAEESVAHIFSELYSVPESIRK